MTVVVATQLGEWSASTRARALQHLPRLSRLLGSIDLLVPAAQPVRPAGRLGQLRYFAGHAHRYLDQDRRLAASLPDAEAIFVQRGLYGLGPGTIARHVERFGGRVVFDLDDNLFVETPSMRDKGAAARWLYGSQQARRILARADAVVVSTEALADALPWHRADVTVLPTVPDVDRYLLGGRRVEGALRVGWAGTVGGLAYLDPLSDLFGRLRSEEIARLVVISSQPWNGPSDFVRWEAEKEATALADLDVGIMPLPDTEYARAKAGYKLLQYMATGLPVVASPVGINVELLDRSGAGFLADTPAEWEDALRTLQREPELAEQMGARGRRFVEAYGDLHRQATTIASLIRPSSTARS